MHVWDINPVSYPALPTVLRTISCPARLRNLSLYLNLTTSGELPVPEAYWRETLNNILENAFSGLTSFSIWLRPPDLPPPDYAVDRLALINVVKSWMPGVLSDVLSVRPWFTLRDSNPSFLPLFPSLSPTPGDGGGQCTCATSQCEPQ